MCLTCVPGLRHYLPESRARSHTGTQEIGSTASDIRHSAQLCKLAPCASPVPLTQNSSEGISPPKRLEVSTRPGDQTPGRDGTFGRLAPQSRRLRRPTICRVVQESGGLRH